MAASSVLDGFKVGDLFIVSTAWETSVCTLLDVEPSGMWVYRKNWLVETAELLTPQPIKRMFPNAPWSRIYRMDDPSPYVKSIVRALTKDTEERLKQMVYNACKAIFSSLLTGDSAASRDKLMQDAKEIWIQLAGYGINIPHPEEYRSFIDAPRVSFYEDRKVREECIVGYSYRGGEYFLVTDYGKDIPSYQIMPYTYRL